MADYEGVDMDDSSVSVDPLDGVRRPQGIARPEPWLSLEDDEQQIRHLIARLAREIWSSVLVGKPAPVVADRLARMRRPQPGDLVVETTSAMYERGGIDTICKGVGYLIAVRQEPFWSAEAVAANPDEFDAEDLERRHKVWYVQYGPDAVDVCRWENADFVAVDIRQWE